MKIESGKWVELQYELYAYTDGEAEELMFSTEEDNLECFVYGVDEAVVPAFMDRIKGLKVGDKFDFTLGVEEAFGPRNQEHMMKLDRAVFENEEGEIDKRVFPGAQIPMRTQEGAVVYGIVLMIEDDGVTVDFNHPLAGENLHYKGEVKVVRDATEEELNPKYGCCSCGDHGCGDHNCSDGCCDGCKGCE